MHTTPTDSKEPETASPVAPSEAPNKPHTVNDSWSECSPNAQTPPTNTSTGCTKRTRKDFANEAEPGGQEYFMQGSPEKPPVKRLKLELDESGIHPSRESVPTPSPDTHTSVKGPTSDALGALTSLLPLRWVSSTAIEQVLTMFSTDLSAYRVVDPSYITVAQPMQLAKKKPLSLKSQHKRILLPLHHDCHWTLATVCLSSGAMEHYDSLRVDSTPYQVALHYFSQVLSQDHPHLKDMDWHFISKVLQTALTFHIALLILTRYRIVHFKGTHMIAGYMSWLWQCTYSAERHPQVTLSTASRGEWCLPLLYKVKSSLRQRLQMNPCQCQTTLTP